jgi:hypothetical protein
VYEYGSGTIEVIGPQRAKRAEIAQTFAEVMLGRKITGRKLPPRRFDLTPLLDPQSFPTDPIDGIAKVKLTKLTLSSSDERLIQTFSVSTKEDDCLQDIVEEAYGAENPLQDGYPWSARIEVRMEPDGSRKTGRKINIDISAPNKCNLRGKTDRERLLLSKYLRSWGLLRGDEQ